MNDIILLDEQCIRAHLNKLQFQKNLEFHLFESLDSTNLYLKNAPLISPLTLCCAEKQTHGRGRFGRTWVSPFGENIYFSQRLVWPHELTRLSGLSLVISLAVLASLKKQVDLEDLLIKWPNDLYWGEKKLAGILIEVNTDIPGKNQLIIGIGINVNTDTRKNPLQDRLWCSLYEISGRQFDRNPLIANLIYELDKYITRFMASGFTSFLQEWEQVDYLKNRWVTISQAAGSIYGEVMGVNEYGQLCLRDKAGTLHELSSGEASLRDKS